MFGDFTLKEEFPEWNVKQFRLALFVSVQDFEDVDENRFQIGRIKSTNMKKTFKDMIRDKYKSTYGSKLW